jgi:hypothetical protein
MPGTTRMRLRVWREAFTETFSDPQRCFKLMGLRGHRGSLSMPGSRVEAREDSCLFEGQGSHPWDTRESHKAGREGSERGQVEKTEDFAQGQPQDEVRGQVEAWPRRSEGRRGHHNLG